MTDALLDKSTLRKFAGLALGIMIGGPLGPLGFGITGLSDPAAATAGSFVGAVLGYLIVAAVLSLQKRRRDRELQHAAEAVMAEARLPSSISVRVHDCQLTLDGVVDRDEDRRRAKEILETIPGIRRVVNRVRVRTANAEFATAPGEISRQIEERLRRAAEEDARGIQIFLDHSRVVLQGRVRSWAEASAAEEAAGGVSGIMEVVNRLEVAA
jgi:osmotically-inducible protein OsmY